MNILPTHCGTRSARASTSTSVIRVYLAGPIAKNDWRHLIVPGLRDALSEQTYYRDMARRSISFELDTLTPGIVCNGPWFVSCDHGCGHGRNTHGVDGDLCCGDRSGGMNPGDVFHASLKRIERADAVFAYFDRDHAYGSCAELGYAYALRKPVFVGFHRKGRRRNDMWFPAQMGFGDPGGHVGALRELWDQFCQSSAFQDP